MTSPVAGLWISSECGCAAGGASSSTSGISPSRSAASAAAVAVPTAGDRSGAAPRSTGESSWIQRDSFWPGRRSRRRTKPLSASRANVSSTSASDRKECQRSVRCFSSPGVCAPRSNSTPSSVDSGRWRPSASSATWRCLITRWPVAFTRRVSSLARSESSAASTTASVYCTMGSRFVDWLQAITTALSDSG